MVSGNSGVKNDRAKYQNTESKILKSWAQNVTTKLKKVTVNMACCGKDIC